MRCLASAFAELTRLGGSGATADAAAASPTWRHSHLVMTTDRREAREIVREPRFCWRSEIC